MDAMRWYVRFLCVARPFIEMRSDLRKNATRAHRIDYKWHLHYNNLRAGGQKHCLQ